MTLGFFFSSSAIRLCRWKLLSIKTSLSFLGLYEINKICEFSLYRKRDEYLISDFEPKKIYAKNVLVQHAAQIFILYFAGLLGMFKFVIMMLLESLLNLMIYIYLKNTII